MSGVKAPGRLLGASRSRLHLSAADTALTIRVYVDHQLSEAFFQGGRVAMTQANGAANDETAAGAGHESAAAAVYSTAGGTLERAEGWSVDSIWVTPDEVLRTQRKQAA